jgi:VanZ family protein
VSQKKRNRILTALVIIALAVIWGNSLLPAEKSDGLSRWVLQNIFRMDSGGLYFDEGNHLLRKAAHMTEIAILAMLIALRMKGKKRFWLYGGLAVPAAAIDETIQLFSHRGSQFKDVCIDTAGVLIGIIIIYLIIGRSRAR